MQAFRLVDRLQHPRVTVAQMFGVVRVSVVLRLAREAVSLEVWMRHREVFQVRALVGCVGEADHTGEAGRTHSSVFAVCVPHIVGVVGRICIAIERCRIQESGIVFTRQA